MFYVSAENERLKKELMNLIEERERTTKVTDLKADKLSRFHIQDRYIHQVF